MKLKALIILYDAGAISSACIPTAQQTLLDIPADGRPSRRTSEVFTSRTWAKDALVTLQASGMITLPRDIGTDILLGITSNIC